MQPIDQTKKGSWEAQLIDIYRERPIFLSRVVRAGTDRGWWLHWCHPRDQNQNKGPKCGYFVSPGQPLQATLDEVYLAIECSIQLESLDNSQEGSFHQVA